MSSSGNANHKDVVPAADDRLVWMDLEMTGLDPKECVIVQMAVIVTDRNLKPLDAPLDLVIWQPDSVLQSMEPFVRSMHQRSGLLDQIQKSKTSLAQAEQQAMELIVRHCSYRTAALCGNSIGQDRRFLVEYMPQIEGYLHYRNIDVSTVKELASWWYGIRYTKPDSGKHTALHDIQQSIEELRFLADKVFKPR